MTQPSIPDPLIVQLASASSVVAFTGAHQLQMALKNKAGGGVDPHAGHNH